MKWIIVATSSEENQGDKFWAGQKGWKRSSIRAKKMTRKNAEKTFGKLQDHLTNFKSLKLVAC